MRTSDARLQPKFFGLAVFAAVAVSAFAPAASALEPQTGAAAVAIAPIFKDTRTALRQGLEGYQAGDFTASVQALKYAADGGQPLARWKLGQMYAAGDGVPNDHFTAYQYFTQIIRSFDDERADPRERSVVASAFVSVGAYNLSGIPNTNVRRNPERAHEMFHYAATNFSDANAQYQLARMYLEGNGVTRDPRLAMQWLNAAAEKNHVDAQAFLGDILFGAKGGPQARRARGLMYLTLAREAASDRQE
ncbi:MAG: sel1 repeat family protein, partial [Beijerinckiaceae bacterium]|nr:sel1 repeat family protein [Beijerinckiaceae bacterium]